MVVVVVERGDIRRAQSVTQLTVQATAVRQRTSFVSALAETESETSKVEIIIENTL